MKKLAVFLTTGVAGVVALLSGLALDAYLHAKDPTLAHREGIFTLSNPGHVLLGAGIALVVVGLIGASYTSLPFGTWTRRVFLIGSLALIVLSSDFAGWAASVEHSAPNAAGTASDHNHAAAPATGVTGAQLAAALKLIDDTRAVIAKYKDQSVAIKAGYLPMEPEGLAIMHYDNLCFDRTTGVIVAFAHDSSSDRGDKSGTCPRGSSNRSTPEMLHVWIIDNPGGPFDADMSPDVLASLK